MNENELAAHFQLSPVDSLGGKDLLELAGLAQRLAQYLGAASAAATAREFGPEKNHKVIQAYSERLLASLPEPWIEDLTARDSITFTVTDDQGNVGTIVAVANS